MAAQLQVQSRGCRTFQNAAPTLFLFLNPVALPSSVPSTSVFYFLFFFFFSLPCASVQAARCTRSGILILYAAGQGNSQQECTEGRLQNPVPLFFYFFSFFFCSSPFPSFFKLSERGRERERFVSSSPAFNYRDALGRARVCTHTQPHHSSNLATCPCSCTRTRTRESARVRSLVGRCVRACVRASESEWDTRTFMLKENQQMCVASYPSCPLFRLYRAHPSSSTTTDSTFAPRERPLLHRTLLSSFHHPSFT